MLVVDFSLSFRFSYCIAGINTIKQFCQNSPNYKTLWNNFFPITKPKYSLLLKIAKVFPVLLLCRSLSCFITLPRKSAAQKSSQGVRHFNKMPITLCLKKTPRKNYVVTFCSSSHSFNLLPNSW